MKDLKFIVMTCEGREHLAKRIIEQLPEVIVNFDNFKSSGKFNSTAWFNYVRNLELAGEDACVQLEDDIILCDDFKNKIQKAISEYPDYLIQFFSMRKKDIEVGTRFEPGGNFLMHQCYYLPKGMAKKIREYSDKFYELTDCFFAPNDVCTREFLRENKLKYVIYCPNLVDHMEERSKVDKRRSTKRQSKTFKQV